MDDLISRQAAIDALGERPMVWVESDYELGARNQYDADLLAIETVPSAQPEIKCIAKVTLTDEQVKEALEKAKCEILAVQPERKKGKWIWITGDVYKCSECETETHVDECFGKPIYNYCPYCNVFMDGYER